MIRLGVLGSTKGTDLQAILDAISKKILKAKVSLVVSNNKNAYILKRAKNNNIPNYYISHESLSRKNFDSLVAKELKKYKEDRKEDWKAILGGDDFRVVEEDQAYSDIASFGEEPQ